MPQYCTQVARFKFLSFERLFFKQWDDRCQDIRVLVDQFEELFRLCRSADDRAALVKLLLEAIHQTDLAIYVLLTIRSDYLGRCPEFRGLPEVLNDKQFFVPRFEPRSTATLD